MTSRADATRAKILDAAKRLLVEGGASSLTLRGIAAAAAVALGNLQYHYASLEVLVDALLRRELEDGKERAAILFSEAAPTTVPLVRLVDILLADHDDEPLVRTFVGIWSLAATTPSLRPRVRDFYAAWGALVAEHLVLRFDISRDEAHTRASTFLACLEGFSLFRSGIAATKDDPSLGRARELLTGILTGPPAVAPRPRRAPPRAR